MQQCNIWWHHFATFDDIILNDLHILDFEYTEVKKSFHEVVHNIFHRSSLDLDLDGI